MQTHVSFYAINLFTNVKRFNYSAVPELLLNSVMMCILIYFLFRLGLIGLKTGFNVDLLLCKTNFKIASI